MDIIFLSDLRVETVIGIFEWERKIHQTVSLDLEMAADIRTAAAGDSIDDTLDYKAVAKRLIRFVEQAEFQLVETLAERCAEIVLNEFPVERLRLKLGKPGASVEAYAHRLFSRESFKASLTQAERELVLDAS